MQKTQWRSRTSSCEFRWLDNSRPQGPKRQLRISKQSSICSRGAGSSHSMDPGVSVQKQNFTITPEKLAKVPGTREETKSHLHWQFLGIRKSLWRSLLESLHVYTTPIGDQWYCRKSSAQSKGRHLCCIAAIRSKWKLVGRFYGMLYLSAKRHRPVVWWEDALWKTFLKPFKGPIIPFGSLVEYHPITAKDQSRIHQLGKKVLPGLFFGYALYAGWIWKGDVLVADLEELETMDASEIYSERLNAKEVIFSKENGKFIFSSRRWMDQIFSGTENIHFGAGTPNSRRKSKGFSWRQNGLFHHLTTHFRMPVKR